MLTLDLQPHRRYLVAGQPEQRLFAALRVRPEISLGQVAPPLAVVFVIDGSGSMNDAVGPSTLSKRELVTRALEDVLEAGALRPDDRVAIVRFDEVARVLLALTPLRERTTIEGTLAWFGRAAGGTAIGRGLDMAARLLSQAGVENGRIVLLTDGEASDGEAGLEAARRLGEAMVPVTAIGVGERWNETMLTRITDLTHGLPIHIVPDGETATGASVPASHLPVALHDELRRATNAAFSQLVLTAVPTPGVRLERVTRVYPTLHEVEAPGFASRLGPLEGGVVTTFLLEFVVPALPEGAAAIARLELSAIRPGRTQAESAGALELATVFSADAGLASRLDPEVMRAVQQRNVGDMLKQATVVAGKDPAQAQALLAMARDLTVRLGNDAMTLVVDRALSDIEEHRTISPDMAKRLVVGGKTKTVALGGPEQALPADLIRRITGV